MAVGVSPARAYDRDRREIVSVYGINSRGNLSEALKINVRPEDMDVIARDWIEYRDRRNTELAEITLEQALEKSYIAKNGMRCLYCSSDQIQANISDTQKSSIYTEVVCNACGKVWEDVYTLTGVVFREDVL